MAKRTIANQARKVRDRICRLRVMPIIQLPVAEWLSNVGRSCPEEDRKIILVGMVSQVHRRPISQEGDTDRSSINRATQ